MSHRGYCEEKSACSLSQAKESNNVAEALEFLRNLFAPFVVGC